MVKLLRHCMNMDTGKVASNLWWNEHHLHNSLGCVFCNYVPCSNTRCIALHVNSIRVIWVPYEYTLNWQQIPLFNFQSFGNYRRNHNGLFLLFSVSLSPALSPLSQWQRKTNSKMIVPWAVSLEEREKRKTEREEKKKDKGRSDQGEICGSCLPGALRTRLNLREIAGDTASVRDQRGFLLCSAYLKHYQ